jgi:hypothetical protein
MSTCFEKWKEALQKSSSAMIGAILATTLQVENVHRCQSYISAEQLITILKSNNP